MNATRDIALPPPGVDAAAVGGDAESHLRTDHLRSGLKRRAVVSGAATFVARGCKFLLQLAATVVLARLLTPEDYGLFAVVFTVITFFSLFKELGGATATVQSAEINHRQVSALFWVSVALGCALALASAAVAPAVGWLYGEPSIAWMMLALAAGFVLTGLGEQHRALLRRQMRFGALASIEVLSFIAGVIVAVASALRGAGYWSLVLMHLTTWAGEAVGAWVMCGWRPGRPARRAGVRRLLAFGGHMTGYEVVCYVARHADNLLVGWFWGARQLGFYDKAYQLLLLPVQQFALPMASVAVPVLSRLQDEPGRFREYFQRCVLLPAALGMPLVAFLFVTADRAIPFVLGPQWVDSVPLFRALAPAAFFGTFNSGMGWVMISLGRTRRQLKWSIFVSALTVASFLVGVRWGTVGVAAAFSACRMATLIPTLVFVCKGSPLSWVEVFKTIMRPALAAAVAALALSLVGGGLGLTTRSGPALVLDGLLFGLLYLAAWAAMPGGRRALAEAVDLVKGFWKRGQAENAQG